jgi:hypothetical protein
MEVYYTELLNYDNFQYLFHRETIEEKEEIVVAVLKKSIAINDMKIYSWNYETKTLNYVNSFKE